MWFNPAELTNAPLCPPATSATLRFSEELPAIAAQKVAKSQESQAPRVRAPARATPKVGAGDTATDSTSPADTRLARVIDQLRGDPGLRYAMEAHDDVDIESVILTLAIRDKAACELRIPKSRYDGFALLELIEKHTTRATLQ